MLSKNVSFICNDVISSMTKNAGGGEDEKGSLEEKVGKKVEEDEE
jgi:hypothetical protein